MATLPLLNADLDSVYHPDLSSSCYDDYIVDLILSGSDNYGSYEPPSSGLSQDSSNSMDTYAPSYSNRASQHPNGLQSSSNSLERVDELLVELFQEINSVCRQLPVPSDPQEWTMEDSAKWLSEMMRQFGIDHATENLYLSGRQLCGMSVEDFRNYDLQWGEILYAQLEIWKAAHEFVINKSNDSKPPNPFKNTVSRTLSATNKQILKKTLSHQALIRKLSGKNNDNDYGFKPVTQTGGRIALWKFLLKLLERPQQYVNVIRWIQIKDGLFKIENSKELARLWGNAGKNNRKTMNYDKMSRSMRQYYKKGILKKTQIRHRLIYQFQPPYYRYDPSNNDLQKVNISSGLANTTETLNLLDNKAATIVL